MDWLQKSSLRVRKDKCIFMSPLVIHIDYKTDVYGLYLFTDKTKVIVEAPSPENVHKLKPYLRLLLLFQDYAKTGNRSCSTLLIVKKGYMLELVTEGGRIQLLTSSVVLVH